MCWCCCNPCTLCCSMAASCCRSLCAFCKVRRHLKQPWACCSTASIVSIIFAVIFIPAGLTLMGFFVDYHDAERLGDRILAWLGISMFIAGIVLLSLGFLLWGCVWRVYHTREKTRIHLEMKQGTLYLGTSAASRFNTSKESPMLTLRNLDTKRGKSPYRPDLNSSNQTDVRLVKIQPRPVSVQTFRADSPPLDISKTEHEGMDTFSLTRSPKRTGPALPTKAPTPHDTGPTNILPKRAVTDSILRKNKLTILEPPSPYLDSIKPPQNPSMAV